MTTLIRRLLGDHSWLLRQRETFAVDFFENNIAAASEKGLADFFAQAHGIIAFAALTQNFCSVRMRYERAQANAAFLYLGERSYGNLATTAEFAEQGTLTGGGGTGGGVIEKCDDRPCCRVTIANFDCQGALSGGGGHHLHRDHLPDQLRFAKTVEARGGENYRIVVARFELVQARVNIAAKRMNLKI